MVNRGANKLKIGDLNSPDHPFNSQHHWWATLVLVITIVITVALVCKLWRDFELESRSRGKSQRLVARAELFKRLGKGGKYM
mmetsp:Transcript_2218/g.4897  ORF Transcript_2218/g.4897 Transcript_2218/m.4897 type:complete len:82 (-) Transcript_2218:398-643(-)